MNIEEIRNTLLERTVIKNYYFSDQTAIPQEYRAEVEKLNEVTELGVELPQDCELLGLWELPSDISDKNLISCVFKNLDLSKWTLDHTTFSKCVFEKCVFPKKLINPSFHGCIFNNVKFSSAENEGKWQDVIFYSGTFCGCILENLSTEHSGFEGCKFNKVSFEKFNSLKRNNFTNCSFEEVNFSAGVLNFVSILNPKLFIKIDLSNSVINHFIGENIIFSKKNEINIQGCDWSYSNIEKCLLDDVDLEGNCLFHTIFTDCKLQHLTFKNLSLKNIWLSSCQLDNIIFEKCDLSCSDFSSSNIYKMYVNSCIAEMSNFQKANLNLCCFLDSDLSSSLLSYANMNEVVFDKCNINLTKQHDMKFAKSSFKDCYGKTFFETDERLYNAEHFY